MGHFAVLKGDPAGIIEGVLIGCGRIAEALRMLPCRMQCELSGQYSLHRTIVYITLCCEFYSKTKSGASSPYGDERSSAETPRFPSWEIG